MWCMPCRALHRATFLTFFSRFSGIRRSWHTFIYIICNKTFLKNTSLFRSFMSTVTVSRCIASQQNAQRHIRTTQTYSRQINMRRDVYFILYRRRRRRLKRYSFPYRILNIRTLLAHSDSLTIDANVNICLPFTLIIVIVHQSNVSYEYKVNLNWSLVCQQWHNISTFIFIGP